jgi:hypothetical protein
VESFIEHYASISVKHIACLNNRSIDGTVEALKNHGNATVLRTMLPYKEYKHLMKQCLIGRCGKKGRYSVWTCT